LHDGIGDTFGSVPAAKGIDHDICIVLAQTPAFRRLLGWVEA
jgi:hypothetical protein